MAALFTIQGVLPSGSDGTSDDDYYTLSGAGIDLGPADGEAAELGQPAPDFTLLDLDGKPVTLSALRGQTVLVNFWASWCVPCRRETPDLVDTYLERVGSGFIVVGVNLQEAAKPARAFAEKYGVTYPVVLDSDGAVAKAYRLSGLPESWIVDSQGILRERKIGAFNRAELAMMLDNVIGVTVSESDQAR